MDLFSLSPGKGPGGAEPSGGAGGGVRSVLDSLPELWEEEHWAMPLRLERMSDASPTYKCALKCKRSYHANCYVPALKKDPPKDWVRFLLIKLMTILGL